MSPAAGYLGRLDAAAGPFAVVCHEQHRGFGHGRPGLDEGLDPAAGADELRKILKIGTVDRPSGRPPRLRSPPEPGHCPLLTLNCRKGTTRRRAGGHLAASIGSTSDKMAWTYCDRFHCVTHMATMRPLESA